VESRVKDNMLTMPSFLHRFFKRNSNYIFIPSDDINVLTATTMTTVFLNLPQKRREEGAERGIPH
jgi:hypothetical protein